MARARWLLCLLIGLLFEGALGRGKPIPLQPLGTLRFQGERIDCRFVTTNSIQCGQRVFFEEHLEQPGSSKFWMDVGICVALVAGAATAAGLTMGLMSMDLMNLQILLNSGTPVERFHASRIIPLVEKHHLLLVSLLLVNACCNEALPLFLDELMHPLTNILVSVTALLLFGEIIPQALCTRYGLAIGSHAAPLVWLIIGGTWLVSYPIARLLDCCLGQEAQAYYHRAQLKELVDIHGRMEGTGSEALSPDECMIIGGALDLKTKTVEDCMCAIERISMINYDGKLDEPTMKYIADSGHSRIPVFLGEHDPEAGGQAYQIVGMILARSLITVCPEHATPVRDVPLQTVPVVPTTKPLYDMLNMFQEGRSHLAVAVDPKDHLTYRGIITLEDVLEQLIGEPISDEMDRRRNLVVTVRPANLDEPSGAATTRCSMPASMDANARSFRGPVSMSLSQSERGPRQLVRRNFQTAPKERQAAATIPRESRETDPLLHD